MRSLDSMPRKGITEKVLCDERGRLCNIRGNTRAEASREVCLACFRNCEAASVVQGGEKTNRGARTSCGAWWTVKDLGTIQLS